MAGVTIRVTIDDSEVVAALDRLAAAGRDLTPAMRDVGEHLLNSTRERFRTETAPDGAPWAPLTAATRAKKPRNKGRILTQDGYLRGNLTYRAGPDSVEVGSPSIYAGTHQFGAEAGSFGETSTGRPIPWGDIPARPFLVDAEGALAPDDEAAVRDILLEHLTGAIEG